jgi:hypothetical protein
VLSRGLVVLLLASPLGGCLAYEFDQELWLQVDGSGTVHVTGRPELWAAFKGTGDPAALTTDSLRALFERSGLQVREVTRTRRDGRPYLFVSAEFDDVNRLGGSPAFPDLQIGLRRERERLVLEGRWPLAGAPEPPPARPEELVAIRFHVPSRIHSHRNASQGVERGNIVSWRQGLAPALAGEPLEFGVEMEETSILRDTLLLFLGAGALGLGLVGGALWLLWRRGRRVLESGHSGSAK